MARVSELDRGGRRAAYRKVPMCCPTNCRLRMCPPRTRANRERFRTAVKLRFPMCTPKMRAGGARFRSGARGWWRSVPGGADGLTHQVPIANVPSPNARQSRAFLNISQVTISNLTSKNARVWRAFPTWNEGVVAQRTGQCRWAVPPSADRECVLPNARGSRAFSYNCALVLCTRSRFGHFGSRRFGTERGNARTARAFSEGNRVVI